MTQALPFRLVGDTDLSALRQAFRKEVQAWAGTWLAVEQGADVKFPDHADVETRNRGAWTILKVDVDCWFAWQMAGRPWRDYAKLLINAPLGSSAAPSSLLEALLDECMSDLATRLLSAAAPSYDATLEQGGLENVRTEYGSGAIFGELGGDLPPQPIALGGSVVSALVGRQSQPSPHEAMLASRESAIGGGVTRLEVVLGQAELTLADLANVSVGDVIRLQSPFRDPLLVRTDDGVPLARARLGVRDGYKAIQLTGKTS